MSRQEDFFNEATKQIRDSYVFQNEETYSDDDVRDIATSVAEYAYQYAVDKYERLIKKLLEQDLGTGYTNSFIDGLRKAMEEQ